jgi:DNA-directed RNA polymerase subunit RPC12/RpoP
MDEFWAALAAAAALAVFGEALKAGLTTWFRRLAPGRVDRCPRCGRENLDRALSTRETLGFGALVLIFALAFTATVLLAAATVLLLVAVVIGGIAPGTVLGTAVALAVATLVTRVVVRPAAALRARSPVRCRDCGYRWPATA